MKRSMRRALRSLPIILLLAALSAGCEDPDLAKLRQKLAREDDPGDRAKITVKIGQQLLQRISKSYKRGTYEAAEEELTNYLDAIRLAYQDLQESGLDARRKPKGFKHLEIHLRKSTRKLEDIARGLPFDKRAPVEAARANLEAMRVDLLQALMKVDE